jgi:hypothetical protein
MRQPPNNCRCRLPRPPVTLNRLFADLLSSGSSDTLGEQSLWQLLA